MEPHIPYDVFPVVSCGIDWLTCTSKNRGVVNNLEDWGKHELAKEKAADGQVSTARRLGYDGLTTSGLFVGRRAHDVMVQLSGRLCTPLAMEAIALSTNVSRIDLQVTVWTEGEQPELADWTYRQLKARAAETYVPFHFALTVAHPMGGTLNLGRRISDAYGRLYDKTAELGKVTPRLLWRYEVEWKRDTARRLARQLLEQRCSPTLVCKRVHAWYTMKGVVPSFNVESGGLADLGYISRQDRDVLTWLNNSVRITVARAMNKHGRAPVLEALGLSDPPQVGKHNA